MLREIFLSLWLCGVPVVCGQSPGLLQQVTGVASQEKKVDEKKPVAASTPAEEKVLLQVAMKVAREKLVLVSGAKAEEGLPAGVTLEDLTNYRHDLQLYISQLEKHLATMGEVAAFEKSAVQAQQALVKWKGFAQSPPYSALLVDGLRNQREVAKEKLVAAESTLEILQRHMDKAKQERLDAVAVAEQVEKARGVAVSDPGVVWRAEAAAVHAQVKEEVLRGVQRIEFIEKQKRLGAKASLDLVNKKLQEVVYDQSFSKEDLDKILQASADRMVGADKEMVDLDKRLMQAQGVRRKLGYDVAAEGKAGEMDRMKVEAADARVSSLEESKAPLEQVKRVEGLVQAAYTSRYELFQAKDQKDREKPRENLQEMVRQFEDWQTYAGSQLSLIDAKSREVGALLSSMDDEDPRGEYLDQIAQAYAGKVIYFRAIQQMSALQIRQIREWLGDFATQDQRRSWGQRAKDTWYVVKTTCVNLGNTSVWSYQDALGNTKSISIWLCVLALTLFLIGNRLISWSTYRVMHWFVGRKKVGEAQANTLRRWLAFLLGFFLVLATLKILAIPLTVFAFFGGALAIGLGFGTQTIIKNFISGIIMLFERQIRVGDVVELSSGRVGSVMEINTRSSVIRSADGAETLVPNSTFLESSVVNLTHTSRTVRRSLKVGVAYGSDVQKVATILQECAERHGKVLKVPEPSVLFEDFGDSALLFSVNYWLHMDDKPAPQVASDLRFMIDKKFVEAGILMPFPQRDLNFNGPIPVMFAGGVEPEVGRVEGKVEEKVEDVKG